MDFIKNNKSLVIGSLFIIFSFYLYFNNRIDSECQVQVATFKKQTIKVIKNYRAKSNRVQFSKLSIELDNCKLANSLGGCLEYLSLLETFVDSFNFIEKKCYLDSSLFDESEKQIINNSISNGIKIIALIAWGEGTNFSEENITRLNWLRSSDVATFCKLKSNYIKINSIEQYKQLRINTLQEFPDGSNSIESLEENSKKFALKSEINPNGKFSFNELFLKSIFAVNCKENLDYQDE